MPMIEPFFAKHSTRGDLIKSPKPQKVTIGHAKVTLKNGVLSKNAGNLKMMELATISKGHDIADFFSSSSISSSFFALLGSPLLNHEELCLIAMLDSYASTVGLSGPQKPLDSYLLKEISTSHDIFLLICSHCASIFRYNVKILSSEALELPKRVMVAIFPPIQFQSG